MKELEFTKIDEKLSILLHNMKYSDYISFIKNNELLKSYDYILGHTDINTLPEMFRKFITPQVIDEVNIIIDNKIKELGLN